MNKMTHKISTARGKEFWLVLSSFALAIGAFLTGGCDGKFVGPPGTGGAGAIGGNPIVGANPFTFEPEVESFTGFATDVWFLNPGVDGDDQITGKIPVDGDGLDLLKNCGFEEFTTGNMNQPSPGVAEVNIQFPIAISLMAQWFLRNADGSRKTTVDIFGNFAQSSASLDISFVSAPVEEARNMPGDLISRLVNTLLYPDSNNTSLGLILPLAGWKTPPGTDPTTFPAPQTLFVNQQYNSCDVVSVLLAAADPQSITAVGGALSEPAKDNANVEHCGTTPNINAQTNTFPPIFTSTGLFQDIFANRYLNAPVRQADDINIEQPQNINDPNLEAALIELSRHEAAVMAWIIGQCLGLDLSSDGTLMDEQVPFLQNGYQYRFSNEAIDEMANKEVGPSNPNNEKDDGRGLLPGPNRY